jgi:hypothetical protein
VLAGGCCDVEVLAASIINGLMMEAVSTPEMSLNFYQTTRHKILLLAEDCNLIICRENNLRGAIFKLTFFIRHMI